MAALSVPVNWFALARTTSGWLREETADNPDRFSRRFVWVVKPWDGAKEFVLGVPEFTVSVALVEDDRPFTFNRLYRKVNGIIATNGPLYEQVIAAPAPYQGTARVD